MEACLRKSIKSLRASEDGLDIKTLRSYTYFHNYIKAVLTSALSFLCLCLCFSLRSRRLEVMGTGKNVARERDTSGERERLPERPHVSLARSVLSCAHYFQAHATQSHLVVP